MYNFKRIKKLFIIFEDLPLHVQEWYQLQLYQYQLLKTVWTLATLFATIFPESLVLRCFYHHHHHYHQRHSDQVQRMPQIASWWSLKSHLLNQVMQTTYHCHHLQNKIKKKYLNIFEPIWNSQSHLIFLITKYFTWMRSNHLFTLTIIIYILLVLIGGLKNKLLQLINRN